MNKDVCARCVQRQKTEILRGVEPFHDAVHGVSTQRRQENVGGVGVDGGGIGSRPCGLFHTRRLDLRSSPGKVLDDDRCSRSHSHHVRRRAAQSPKDSCVRTVQGNVESRPERFDRHVDLASEVGIELGDERRRLVVVDSTLRHSRLVGPSDTGIASVGCDESGRRGERDIALRLLQESKALIGDDSGLDATCRDQELSLIEYDTSYVHYLRGSPEVALDASVSLAMRHETRSAAGSAGAFAPASLFTR